MSKKKLSKVIILGDSAVGKTCLLNAFVDSKFTQSYKATVGADFMEKQINIDGKIVHLEIWDTAGQERFRSLGGAFYRGADCCVLVYDITKLKSFQSLDTWKEEFINQGAPREPQKFPFVVLGNKIDLESERQVSEQQLQQFLSKNPNMIYFPTSAKQTTGVQKAFEGIARQSIANQTDQIFIPVNVPIGKLSANKKVQKKKCC